MVNILTENNGALQASFVERLGSDLSVVNAARVTMGIEHAALSENDTRLINFLAREQHVTPFRHPTITFRCKAPIAIARQLGKHQTGFSWNEMSRRYKDGSVEIYIPETLHQRPSNLHSGSGGIFPPDLGNELTEMMAYTTERSVLAYEELLAQGVAPEQARFVLPQNMITEWVWTGSLYGWSEVYRQRSSSHAQYEVRLFAKQIDDALSFLFPISWKALKENM